MVYTVAEDILFRQWDHIAHILFLSY